MLNKAWEQELERGVSYHSTADKEMALPRSELQWLALENALHKRLANVVDLNDAIDGFAVWLSRLVNYDLVGFHEVSTGRNHFFCSSHGPSKHDTIARAQAFLNSVWEGKGCPAKDGCLIHRVQTPHGAGAVVVLRNGAPFMEEEKGLIRRGLAILDPTLERVLYYELLYQQSRQDGLTGLPNRRVFDEAVEQAMADAKRYGRPLSLAILDLDNFKEINDTMGHDAGDEVLKRVAQTLASSVRTTDLLARLGGDEFVLIMPNTDMAQASTLAKRIIEKVRDLDITTPTGHRLGISIGISQWDGASSVEQWLKAADSLLYQAKSLGRNRVES